MAYGIAPFKVNYYDADTVHANDERIRARFFAEGVRLMRSDRDGFLREAGRTRDEAALGVCRHRDLCPGRLRAGRCCATKSSRSAITAITFSRCAGSRRTSCSTARLPLWNAYSASGEPWLANPQTGVFYPPAWLFLVLPFARRTSLYLLAARPASRMRRVSVVRAIDAARRRALAAALALTFCGPVMSLLDVSNNLATFAWIPLIVWCALSGVSATCGAVGSRCRFSAGEPFFAAIGALLFVDRATKRMARSHRRRGDVVRAFRRSSFCRFCRWMLEQRPRARRHDARDIFLGLDAAARLAVARHSAEPAASAFDPSMGQHFIPIVYVGVLTIVFALIGIFAARRRAARMDRAHRHLRR